MRLVSHSLNRAISDFATNTRALEDLLGVVTREGWLSESIKKGSHKATLWLCASVDHSAGVSAFDLRRRRFTSPRNAATMYCPAVSPSSIVSSTSFTTSCGTLACIFCDLAFTLDVAITAPYVTRWVTVYAKKRQNKALTWSTPIKYYSGAHQWFKAKQKAAKPAGATNTNGPLTTTVSLDNEVAMFHRNTPHTGRAALTLKKITWRFLVLGEHAPVIVRITASSEQEARAAMPPCCIAIFAARIMRGGSANA